MARLTGWLAAPLAGAALAVMPAHADDDASAYPTATPVAVEALSDPEPVTAELSVGAGEAFRVTLPFQPATGFEWTVRGTDSDAFALVSTCESEAAEGPGSAATQTFVYRASEGGDIVFDYVQPWAADAVAKTVTITVAVHAAEP